MAGEYIGVDCHDTLMPAFDNLHTVEEPRHSVLERFWTATWDDSDRSAQNLLIDYLNSLAEVDVEPIEGSYEELKALREAEGIKPVVVSNCPAEAVDGMMGWIERNYPEVFQDFILPLPDNVRAPKYETCARLGISAMVDDWPYSRWHPSSNLILIGDYPYHKELGVPWYALQAPSWHDVGRILVAHEGEQQGI